VRYELLYTATAVKDIKKLDPLAQKRLRNALERFRDNPFANAKKMINSSLGDCRFRVGDYRIIFDSNGDKIIILRIAHRKEVYR